MSLSRNSPDHYAGLSVGLHWLMLLLIAAAYAAIDLREAFPKGSDPREALKALHYTMGFCVLLLGVGRIAVRAFAGPPPAIQPPPGAWLRVSAIGMVLALYALMIVQPLLGLATLGAEGKTFAFLGLELPPLVGTDKALAEDIGEVHEAVGTAGYFLIGLHAAAALFHHYVRRDNTLSRIVPRWRMRLVAPD